MSLESVSVGAAPLLNLCTKIQSGRRFICPSVKHRGSRVYVTSTTHSTTYDRNPSQFRNEIATEDEIEEEIPPVDDITVVPSCPIPDFSEALNHVTLLNPLKVIDKLPNDRRLQEKKLLVYVPGMDCTGQGIRPQVTSLVAAGYDIRCVYIPSSDRSSWSQLVNTLTPMLRNEVRVYKHLTLVGESFGGRLALHLAKAAPDIVSQLVLVNPATNLSQTSMIASFFGQTGILGLLPEPLYELAQDILLPLMLKQERVSLRGENVNFLSPVDFVPAHCAAYRLSMLNDPAGLSDVEVRSICTPTLILTSAKDLVVSSLDEGLRLQNLIPNSKRVILPESGHIALLETSMDLSTIIRNHEVSSSEKDDDFLDERMDELGKMLGPWRFLTSPLVSGAENLPSPSLASKKPVLFVGNHTMFGVYDSAVLVHELYLRGFKCRSLAHPGHWLSGVGELFERYGCVKATMFEAYRVLKEGKHVLLFPGGAREVCKRRGEEYKLLWKSTIDFVRMAIRHNAIIVPFSALGGDDAFRILLDSNELLSSPVGDLIRQLYTSAELNPENVHPISAFPFTNLPSPIPLPSRIERIYFHFGEYVDTGEIKVDVRDRQQCQALYLLIRKRVEDGIEQLKQTRENDTERMLENRLLAKLQRIWPARRKHNDSIL